MKNTEKDAIIAEINALLEANGNYKLNLREYMNEFHIGLSKKDFSYESKVPDIYIENNMYGTKEFDVQIQTTSYGNADLDEILIIAKELEKAVNLAKALIEVLERHGEKRFVRAA
jgi:hypothetical protein